MPRKSSEEILAGLGADDDGRATRSIHAHTLEKLGTLSLYFDAFSIACSAARGGCFVDGMAGPGLCRLEGSQRWPFFVWGSPLIAARSEPLFEKCLFLELESKNVSALKARIERYRERCSAHEGDVNEDLVRLVRAEISARAPCLILLDPEGPDLHWSTVTGLATLPGRNRQPELLILFPLDMALLRMLPKSGEMSENDVVRVNAMFGDERWQQIYAAKLRGKLQPSEAKQQYLDLYKRNLENLGYEVRTKEIATRARPGTGRGRREMYHLIFATQHPDGLKIMGDVFRRTYVLDVSVTEQRPLFE